MRFTALSILSLFSFHALRALFHVLIFTFELFKTLICYQEPRAGCTPGARRHGNGQRQTATERPPLPTWKAQEPP